MFMLRRYHFQRRCARQWRWNVAFPQALLNFENRINFFIHAVYHRIHTHRIRVAILTFRSIEVGISIVWIDRIGSRFCIRFDKLPDINFVIWLGFLFAALATSQQYCKLSHLVRWKVFPICQAVRWSHTYTKLYNSI